VRLYNIFLDDYRQPMDAYSYTKDMRYVGLDWIVVTSYPEFVKLVKSEFIAGHQLNVVSFDHDLADGHYHKNMQEGVLNYDATSFTEDSEKTGYHCAKFLAEFLIEYKLPTPKWMVHSMNPVGKENITAYMNNFEKFRRDDSRTGENKAVRAGDTAD
jgi:hypothetical protein